MQAREKKEKFLSSFALSHSLPETSKTQIHVRVLRERRSWNDDFALMSFPSQRERQTKSSYSHIFFPPRVQNKAFYQKAHGYKFIALQTLSYSNKAIRTVLRNWVWGTYFAKFYRYISSVFHQARQILCREESEKDFPWLTSYRRKYVIKFLKFLKDLKTDF